jgi:flagellar basal-body rod modification protein FlgD
METGAINSTLPAATAAQDRNEALRDLDMDQFLQLMITELQNQDPLNPLENAEILQQISQIREIGATGRLTETLEAVLLGQNLTSATSMIGKTVKALSDDAKEVSGLVDRVTVTEGEPRLHIGDKAIRLKNVKEVLSTVEGETGDDVAAQVNGQLGGR